MSDVTCKVIISHLEFMEKKGFSSRTFLENLSQENPSDPFLDPTFLMNGKNRIPWDTFATFSNALDEYYNTTEWEEEYFDYFLNTTRNYVPHFWSLMGLIVSTYQAYRINNFLFGPSFFGNAITSKAEKTSDKKFRITLEIGEGYRDCPNFFKISEHGLRRVPNFLGLPNAYVDAQISSRRCIYDITPPPAGTLWEKTRRFARLFFFAPGALREFSEQDRQLRENYESLLKTEIQLRKTQAQLERRVEERTLELQLANQTLHRQIQNILEKDNENRDLHERVVHLQKLEAIGTLVGGISHEINNVLQGIFLSLSLADMKASKDNPLKDHIMTAKKFTERGQDLMKQVLSFSRKVGLEKKAVEVLPAIREAASLMRSTLAKNIVLKESYKIRDSDRVTVLGDLTRLQQVIINLCTNAAHAIKSPQGEISIAVRKIENKPAVEIRVCDNGEGIPPEIRNRIFEPFFTTKNIGEGTGMGLAVVHGIIQALDGSIDFISEVGRGTEFFITLPTIPHTEKSTENILETPEVEAPQHILVVDDEPELLGLFAEVLALFKYKVTATQSPIEALHLISSGQHHFDLLLTDYSMPEMTGIELAKRISQIRPHLPVILCTGYSEINLFDRKVSEFASAHLIKPFNAETLHRMIQNLVQKKSNNSESGQQV